jgi:MoaA/NifB/PqqE/SkfB family radical SAM enzyme
MPGGVFCAKHSGLCQRGKLRTSGKGGGVIGLAVCISCRWFLISAAARADLDFKAELSRLPAQTKLMPLRYKKELPRTEDGLFRRFMLKSATFPEQRGSFWAGSFFPPDDRIFPSMRKLVFGYSTRCNIRCDHCVATADIPAGRTMDHTKAKELIAALAQAGVGGISFSAGEPFLYFQEMVELVNLCRQLGIYTRIVTNSFWAGTGEAAARLLAELRDNGLCQLRLSYSRWHQQHVSRDNVVHAARGCRQLGLDYFISFVTDFSAEDEPYEQFLRDRDLRFFPEPVIYAGRAESFPRRIIRTDYQANCCDMNPYLTPDLDLYGCCDAGRHFPATNFFYLGNLQEQSPAELFGKSEKDPLFDLIRTMGITNIASFAGMAGREIISYSKCELCRQLFNSPATLARLRAETLQLAAWRR